MRTIVLIDESARIGGAEINLLRILPRLQREGWTPVVLVPEDGPLLGKLTALDILCHIVPGGPFYSVSSYIGNDLKVPNPLAWLPTLIRAARWAFALERTIRQIEPDIVQTVSLLSHLFGGWAARRAGCPVVSHVQDIVAERSGLGLYHAIFQAWARRVPSRIVCISPLVKKQFHVNAATVHKTLMIWNMVDIDQLCHEERLAETSRAPEIGTVARLTRWKGQHIGLQAARQLRAGGYQFRWRFVGDAALGEDDYARELGEIVRGWQLEENVCFVGWVENMAPMYHSLDVLVHVPTEPEPFGLVIAEALACGLPVIASHSGLDEIIQEAGGILVPAGDAKATASAIVHLMKQLPAQRRDYGQKARATALKYFSPEAIMPQWLRLYEEVLGA